MSYRTVNQHLRVCLAVIALACGSTPQLQAAERQGTSVIGSWKLSAVLDSSDISALDEEEAEQLIGHVMTISRDKVQLDERVCLSPEFEVIKAETNKYFREQAHASAKKLGLPNPVTAVIVSCTEVYIKAPNRLVVHWKGYFFDAVRVRGNSCQQRFKTDTRVLVTKCGHDRTP
jgi:hypothetical protein